jgi:hypothetical protein
MSKGALLMHKLLVASILSLTITSAWASGASLGFIGGFMLVAFICFLLSIICSAIIVLSNIGVRSIFGFLKYAWRIFLVSSLLSGAWMGLLLALNYVINGIAFWALPGTLICFIIGLVKTTASAQEEKRLLGAGKGVQSA